MHIKSRLMINGTSVVSVWDEKFLLRLDIRLDIKINSLNI